MLNTSPTRRVWMYGPDLALEQRNMEMDTYNCSRRAPLELRSSFNEL